VRTVFLFLGTPVTYGGTERVRCRFRLQLSRTCLQRATGNSCVFHSFIIWRGRAVGGKNEMRTNFDDDNNILQQKRQRTLAVLLFFPTRHCVYIVYHCSDNTQDDDYGFVLRYPVTGE
jgi:hypothetical protein